MYVVNNYKLFLFSFFIVQVLKMPFEIFLIFIARSKKKQKENYTAKLIFYNHKIYMYV